MLVELGVKRDQFVNGHLGLKVSEAELWHSALGLPVFLRAVHFLDVTRHFVIYLEHTPKNIHSSGSEKLVLSKHTAKIQGIHRGILQFTLNPFCDMTSLRPTLT